MPLRIVAPSQPGRVALSGLEDRVFIVAGGTSGIGRALADVIAASGGRVVVTSRGGERTRRAAEELAQAHGVEALGVAADVTSPRDARDLVRETLQWAGDVHGLANASGYAYDAKILNTPLDRLAMEDAARSFEDVWRVDLLGSVNLTRAILPTLIARGGGSLVYTANTPALVGFKGSPYTSAKAALLGFMRDVANVHGPQGVRANAVAPGNILTPATWDELTPEERDAAALEAPLRRWGTPVEAAGAMAFLLSGMSSFITGQTLVVDGGTVRY